MKKAFILIVILSFMHISPLYPQNNLRLIHVFVALCDNEYQGIVPVPDKIGDGDDPVNNLYWGAGAGVKTFFKKSSNWQLIYSDKNIDQTILERCIFKYKNRNVFLIADAYRGKEIRKATITFLKSAAGDNKVDVTGKNKKFNAGGSSDLLVYIGHDGLMDFTLAKYPRQKNKNKREVIILACMSKVFFNSAVKRSGAKPLLWTTGLMAPEAYTLEAALEGWVRGESDNSIRLRAAKAYHQYQQCGLTAAKRLLVTGY